jgi:hypothetical protein
MTDSFFCLTGKDLIENSIACDGPFIFLLSSCGLYKIGSGLGSTVSGRLYASNKKNVPKKGTLLFFNVFNLSYITREVWTQ